MHEKEIIKALAEIADALKEKGYHYLAYDAKEIIESIEGHLRGDYTVPFG